MAHPLIPQVIELATPIAEALGLEVVGAVFQTNQSPPVLRVDVRNPQQDTGLDDCERMSRALEATLDTSEMIPDHYVLEISSPGLSRLLTSDREFISFKGFPVVVFTEAASASESGKELEGAKEKGQKEWKGNLVGRDETAVHLNQKGRPVAIPNASIIRVQLDEQT